MKTKTAKRKAAGCIVVPIATFAPEPFEILKEIPVVVQPADDEFSATFFDANINTQGCNETEAVENLKELILDIFEHLGAQPAKRLGPGPKRQLAVLQEFIRKRR